ncbi:MAG: hypothetical protein H0V44_12010 [Planctomycetes bacterium]|nr:hypothetical protein [Planctomycetota bacterium]
MRVRLSGADYFHHLLHRINQDHGGSGNCGQLRLRLERPLADPRGLEAAWHAAGQQAWTLGATYRSSLRGPYWRVRGPADLRLDISDATTDALGDAHLRAGLSDVGSRMRLAYAAATQPGVVLTWDHRLSDARGVIALLDALPRLAAGGRLGDRWWSPGHREPAGQPATLAARGVHARGSVEHIRGHRLVRLWRPGVPADNPAAPLRRASMVMDPARVESRQRAATGRLSETPFLLAAVAAALEDIGGIGGDLLFPLAVDGRPRTGGAMLANQHSFLFLRVPEGLATRDLVLAARHLKDAHRQWVAADVTTKMSAALSFFPIVGERLARAELGNRGGGLAASCLVANTGAIALPETWFGSRVAGVDLVASVPGRPGLAVLFHRDRRGLVCDVIAAGAVPRLIPPEKLAQCIAFQLTGRVLPQADP